jgi:hypothetical protein
MKGKERMGTFGETLVSQLELLDDKGRVVNLNGGDWTFTLMATSLYQY